QRWTLRRVGGCYMIVDRTGKAISRKSETAGRSTQLIAKTADQNDRTQLWKVIPAGDGSYFIAAYDGAWFVDVSGDQTDNNTAVQLYSFHGKRNQRFWFEPISGAEPMSDWGAQRQDLSGSDWDHWDGTEDTAWYYSDAANAARSEQKMRTSGAVTDFSGTAETYYIQTASELAGVAQLVRDGITDFNGANIVLTRDIDLGGIEWRRIGNDDRPFRGSFIGGDHAIIGLSITTTDSVDGFFGCIRGGVICDFAIKGAISGDFNTGGVCGRLDNGIIRNVYSEVSIARATDDNEGGIAGRVSWGGCVEHCTQNARINSGDKDPDRAGIGGYCVGMIRYCVNLASVDCNWNYCGGIAGECVGGMIEYCANYGQISGGGDTQWAGGIVGKVKENGLVFGCYNEGYVYSSGDDYIGGICGDHDDSRIYCCINAGNVTGRSHVGGITGDSNCKYCLNTGRIVGSGKTGAITGDTSQWLNWCRSLRVTSIPLNGTHDDNGAEWVTAEDLISGKVCVALDHNGSTLSNISGYCDNGAALGAVFYQNLGADPIPGFSGAGVALRNGSYENSEYEVSVSYRKGYGTVTGGGVYENGAVVLKAVPDDGCVFDHFEVTASSIASKPMYEDTTDPALQKLTYSYPAEETTVYKEPELTLTERIDRCYTVKAVFTVYDETPEDLRQRVRLQLRCSDGCGGWNNDTIPVYLLDSAGEQHLWEIDRRKLDDTGEKVERTFDLGAAIPIAVYAYPNFGGGLTFRGMSLRASIWINDTEEAIEAGGVSINSYPFVSSGYNGDHMHLTFDNMGKASVGYLDADGKLDVKNTYQSPTDAWDAVQKLGEGAVLRLDSPWLIDRELSTNGSFTLDLNGFPMIRSIKKAAKNGELIRVRSKASLEIIDSAPDRVSCSAFKGGSLQGGRSKDTGGLVQVDAGGTLRMTGGALYNGGSTNYGGALQNSGGSVTLENVLISSCWANKKDGGGIYTAGGAFTAVNCKIQNCNSQKNGGAAAVSTRAAVLENCSIVSSKAKEGGAVYVADGELEMYGGTVKNCNADKGGAICNKNRDDSTIYCRSVSFEKNRSKGIGGAISIHADTRSTRQVLGWLLGCTFCSNAAGDTGGAICIVGDAGHPCTLYMEDCTVTNNASSKKGGGIYVTDRSTIDLGGTTVIRSNNGAGNRDDLILGENSYLYDSGLRSGSDIYLASTEDRSINITAVGHLFNEKHLEYLHCEAGTLSMIQQVPVSSSIQASVFTDGSLALMSGAGIILLLTVFAVYRRRMARNEDRHEDR
ncbi:MAG: RICIN domain-containing protein, partial [Oscillospiraceae bacterium]|nr:RICIN domain-containing protein [Oscillospiraceae bacterium]